MKGYLLLKRLFKLLLYILIHLFLMYLYILAYMQAQLLQQLVDFIRGSDGSGYGGGSEGDITTGGGSGSGGHKTGLGRKSSSSGSGSSGGNLSGEGASEAELLSTGAVFALACLKRSAPAVRNGYIDVMYLDGKAT